MQVDGGEMPDGEEGDEYRPAAVALRNQVMFLIPLYFSSDEFHPVRD